MALCLHDKLGFGYDRTRRFMEGVEKIFDEINEGRLSLEDIRTTLKEEVGLKIADE